MEGDKVCFMYYEELRLKQFSYSAFWGQGEEPAQVLCGGKVVPISLLLTCSSKTHTCVPRTLLWFSQPGS